MLTPINVPPPQRLFFQRIREHMKSEPFRLKSSSTNQFGWEKLVYEHEKQKSYILIITGKENALGHMVKERKILKRFIVRRMKKTRQPLFGWRRYTEMDMPVICDYTDFLEYMSKC